MWRISCLRIFHKDKLKLCSDRMIPNKYIWKLTRMKHCVALIGSPNVGQIYSLVLGLLRIMISLQKKNVNGDLGEVKRKQSCFLCAASFGLYFVMLQASCGRVTDRAKLCVLVCEETLFFIGFAWLKLLLAFVCACKSV